VRVGTNGDGIADTAERNVIAGNATGALVFIQIAPSTVVAGNYIGTDATGSQAVGSSQYGVFESRTSDVRIGTNGDGMSDSAERNVISGNFNNSKTAHANVVFAVSQNSVLAGNYIGVDATGSQHVGTSGVGVNVSDSSGIRIGTNGDGLSDDMEGNVIAF